MAGGELIDIVLEPSQLKRDRPRVRLVHQQQVHHQIGLERSQIARAIRDGAIRDFEHSFENADVGRRLPRQALFRKSSAICNARSSTGGGYPRKRHPSPRVIPSITSPEKAERVIMA